MTIAGWIFLTLSLTFVCGLALWCFYRVLTLPVREGAGRRPKSR